MNLKPELVMLKCSLSALHNVRILALLMDEDDFALYIIVYVTRYSQLLTLYKGSEKQQSHTN